MPVPIFNGTKMSWISLKWLFYLITATLNSTDTYKHCFILCFSLRAKYGEKTFMNALHGSSSEDMAMRWVHSIDKLSLSLSLSLCLSLSLSAHDLICQRKVSDTCNLYWFSGNWLSSSLTMLYQLQRANPNSREPWLSSDQMPSGTTKVSDISYIEQCL